MRLSARNQIPATVTAITAGEATANVELDAGGVRLVASITVEAARELKLAEGTQVTAVIKASDVIVAVELSPGGTASPCAGGHCRCLVGGAAEAGAGARVEDAAEGDVRLKPSLSRYGAVPRWPGHRDRERPADGER